MSSFSVSNSSNSAMSDQNDLRFLKAYNVNELHEVISEAKKLISEKSRKFTYN